MCHEERSEGPAFRHFPISAVIPQLRKALYQGMTSVVPHGRQKTSGLQPLRDVLCESSASKRDYFNRLTLAARANLLSKVITSWAPFANPTWAIN
jgi:hypothetical protein